MNRKQLIEMYVGIIARAAILRADISSRMATSKFGGVHIVGIPAPTLQIRELDFMIRDATKQLTEINS